MKFIVLLCNTIIIIICSGTNCQVIDCDTFPLICPHGMKGKGVSWYTNSPTSFVLQSTIFSICVQCQREEGSQYDQIEICLANNVDILNGFFSWNSLSYDNQLSDLPICSLKSPNCGLTLNTQSQTLGDALQTSDPIYCKNQKLNHSTNKNQFYDIELVCPDGSNFFGLERFTLPPQNGRFIPVFALLCKPINEHLEHHLISIYAQGMKNDSKIIELFAKNPSCPNKIVKAKGSRCTSASVEAYFGLSLITENGESSFIQLIPVSPSDKHKEIICKLKRSHINGE